MIVVRKTNPFPANQALGYRLLVTDANSSAKVFGEKTLAMSVCHCLASFPLPRAAVHPLGPDQGGVMREPECPPLLLPAAPASVAFAGTSGGVGSPVCSFAVFISLPVGSTSLTNSDFHWLVSWFHQRTERRAPVRR